MKISIFFIFFHISSLNILNYDIINWLFNCKFKKMNKLKIKLISVQEIADNTMQYNFTKSKKFNFKAGQFVVLDIINPKFSDDRPSFRSLSIASSPHESILSFIMRYSDSAFKKSIKELKDGDEVFIKGPFGHMHLPENEITPVVFLVAGVGVTPALSMIRFLDNKTLKNPVTVFYANRTLKTAACLEELKKEVNLLDYKFFSVLSDEDGTCECIRGRINRDLVLKNVVDVKKTQFYIVGTSGFSNAMKGILEELEVKKNQINIDNFG